MKHIFKITIVIFLLLVQNRVTAQDPITDSLGAAPPPAVPTYLPFGVIHPYDLLVTYEKTTHLIFPSAIRYVDLGSENLTAGKADDAENVLRIKAAVRNFAEETNFSVITEDGKFYNFNARYSEYPDIFNIDFTRPLKERSTRPLVQLPAETALLKELGSDPPSLALLVMETIYKQNKRFIRHIGSESFGIQLLLKGIYTHNGKIYLHTQIKNSTHIPFAVDFISFTVVDKKAGKRTVIQERAIEPLREYKKTNQIAGTSTERNVFLLEQITIPDDKVLIMEVYEKNGGRHQSIRIENNDIIKARLIKNLHLKL